MIVALRGCETIAREKFMVRYNTRGSGEGHSGTWEIIPGQRGKKSISPLPLSSSSLAIFLHSHSSSQLLSFRLLRCCTQTISRTFPTKLFFAAKTGTTRKSSCDADAMLGLSAAYEIECMTARENETEKTHHGMGLIGKPARSLRKSARNGAAISGMDKKGALAQSLYDKKRRLSQIRHGVTLFSPLPNMNSPLCSFFPPLFRTVQ